LKANTPSRRATMATFPKSSRPPTYLAQTARLLGLLAALAAFGAAASERSSKAGPARIPRVQIAILLDNSGSMSGLLNQARTQLWKVVNEFAQAKQKGRAVRLELALFEYGDGVKRISPFTSNLDLVSEQLFGMAIRGGEEWCGAVISAAVRELEWSGDPDDLKLIYIAGNEPFTQGPVHFREAIAEAKRKGIVVNTIHCGGDEPTWREGARVAGGSYLSINHNAAVAQITTPQDSELARLGVELNQTYVGYGTKGKASISRQQRMDYSAASAAPAAMAERSVAKAGRNYINADWDLVDATKEGKVKPGELKDEELPEEMRKLSGSEREAFVARKAKQRAELQKKIAELSEERRRYIAEESKKQGKADTTFDTALTRSVREHGAAKAISF
jgi:hypothetical protein